MTPDDLLQTLQSVTPREYVRFTADWLARAEHVDQAPALSGEPVLDALVAAAAGHVSFVATGRTPSWTEEPARSLPGFWYPGPDSLFPNALVHSPLVFRLHGILIEADSLVSV